MPKPATSSNFIKLIKTPKATPHKDCASDAQSIFCEISQKKRKQMVCKAVRRSLCGVALILCTTHTIAVRCYCKEGFP